MKKIWIILIVMALLGIATDFTIEPIIEEVFMRLVTSDKNLQERYLGQPLVDSAEVVRQALVDAYNNGDWEKVVSYGKAIEEHGDTMGYAAIAYAAGLCHYGEYETARLLLLKMLESNSNDKLEYLYNTLGVSFFLEGKNEEALPYFKKASETNPTYPRPYIMMAKVYEKEGKNEEAINSYLAAIDIFYSDDLFDEAEGFSEHILEIDDTNAEAYIYLAATSYKQDLTAEYEANRDKAKELCGIVAFDRINELIKK